ncbi:MMPL family transporter, partial [Jiangella aurantiaca]
MTTTPTHRPGPLGRLAGVSFRHRWRVLLGWAAALAVAAGLAAAFGGDYEVDYSSPGSDSQQAQRLLLDGFPAQAGEPVDVVVHSDDPATDPDVQADVTALLDELRTMPHVVAVDDPYTTAGGLAPDGQTLQARMSLDVDAPEELPVADAELMLEAAEEASRPGLDVALGGDAIRQAESGEFGGEMVGLVAAAVILLVTFGTVVAAGLPIGVAVAGLAVSSMLAGVVAAIMDVPSWAPILASLIGIALGIDYVLLMVTRFREWRAAGLEPERAVVATLDTAGRAVMVAGGTVMISMFGLFAMGLSFMRGAAVVTMVAVLIVMAAAATLFPALLGFFGHRIERWRLPIGRRGAVAVAEGGHVEPSRGWLRWSRLIERRNVVAVTLGGALMLALAAPFLGARFGFPDAGNDPADHSSRQAYDLLADGFGAGANGPLLLVTSLAGDEGAAALPAVSDAVAATPGVAAVLPPVVDPSGGTALLTVLPEAGPQDAATEDVVHTLRDDVLPAAEADTGLDVHVGGVTAAAIDVNESMAGGLPLLIGGVVTVSMVLLLVSFRSVVIMLTAAVMNLLSVAAAYGVVALVLEGGW